MVKNPKQLNLNVWLLALGVPLASLYISPSFSLEPIDLPKMYLLVILAFTSIGFILIPFKQWLNRAYLPVLSVSILFILQMTLVLFLSGAPLNQQFFGANGRNTGFLTYLSLLAIFLSAMHSAEVKLIKIVFSSLLLTGLVSSSYGLIQVLGHDPISWNNPHGSMIGFLGNPDFSSAFLGVVSAGSFSVLFSDNRVFSGRIRSFVLLNDILALYLIVKSHAIQGMVIYGLGFLISFGIFLVRSIKVSRLTFVIYIFIATGVSIFALLGALKIGPLASYLYKLSVRQRGFYWRAGREMLMSHPFFGVGMDSYGDWYFQKRSANAGFKSAGTSSNASHNVLYDIGSNGGFPLLALYLALIALVVWSIIYIARNRPLQNPYIVGLITSWIAYEVQSIVSINQIGLAIWGWLLGGLIVGYVLNSKLRGEQSSESPRNRKNRLTVSKDYIVLGVIFFALALTLVQPAFSADHNFKIAVESRDANKVVNAALSYPEDTSRTMRAANMLNSSGLQKEALNLAKHVLKINPRSYEAWNFIYILSAPNSVEKNVAFQKLKELNPHDPSLK